MPFSGSVFSDPERDIANEHVAYGAVDPDDCWINSLRTHTCHAGELQIECQYCHTYAKRSIHAGLGYANLYELSRCQSNGQLRVIQLASQIICCAYNCGCC